MTVLMWVLLLLLLHSTALSVNREWCPPTAFHDQLKKRSSTFRTAIISEIHGQLKRTGDDWGIFTDGNTLSRFIYHHIGALGFDRIYLNVIYNGTVHPTPPTVEEIYPPSKYCVSEWYNAGVIVWQPFTFAGPMKDWPIDPDTNKPSLIKDLYKCLRGINPTFEKIKKNKAADWVLVADIDEYLVPVNWHPTHPDWCQPKNPTLIASALQQMQIAATTRELHSFQPMFERRNIHRRPGDVCLLGYSANEDRQCQEIASFVFPVYFWTNSPKDVDKTNVHPLLRSKQPMAYDYDIESFVNVTEERDTQYQTWKSIYKMSVAPLLTNPRSMHTGPGFGVLAPRKYHGVLSFDLAHVKKFCVDQCETVLKRDNRLNGVAASYGKCMEQIAKT